MASEKLRKMRLSRTRRIKELPCAPETRAPPTAKETPALPPIAAKADDLDAIKKAVEDAASVGAPLWLSYLFLLFYIAIAAAGVKHADLLLENPVELPFLNIKLPLIAFFVLAPVLFVIVHIYVLAHFVLLSEKANLFHIELKRQIDGVRSHEIREGLRKQLPINVFIQFLAGPVETREGRFSVLLWAVAWISLVAGPVLVLLLLQVQFLSFHDSRVTWLHRGALIVDLAFIWGLWMKILAGRGKSDASEKTSEGLWAKFWQGAWDGFLQLSQDLGWPLTGLIVAFSVLVATFPGEWRQLPYSLAPALEPKATTATEAIFGKVDPLNRNEKDGITGSWPANTLRLKEFDIYEALKVEDRPKFDEKPHSYIFHERHLEHADLRGARLGKADLRGTHLEGAWLDSAMLDGSTLEEASLQGASLRGAYLRGANLNKASLDGASLRFARLLGASLNKASLDGASLEFAQLQGASLDEAQLQGALLNRAELQGASLEGAQFQGASLFAGELQGASLDYAKMEATDLTGSIFWRASRPRYASTSLMQGLAWKAIHTAKQITKFRIAISDRPWTAADYIALRSAIEKRVPEGDHRTEALNRIKVLDCARKDLAPCDAKAKGKEFAFQDAPREVREAYERALAKVLRILACDGGQNAIHILRGLARDIIPLARRHTRYHHPFRVAEIRPATRLADTGSQTPALIDAIIKGENCPVSAALTEADKANLLKIKKEAEEQAAAAEAEKPSAKEEAQQIPEPTPSRPRSQSKKKKPR